MFKTNSLFLKNFSIYFLGLGLSGIISFATIPLIVRVFGVEKYGSFSLIQNVILVLITFGGGWLNQCVLRFNDMSGRFKATMFQLYFAVFIPVGIICLSILYSLTGSVVLSLTGLVTMIMGSLSALSITFYQSRFNARKSFSFDLIRIISFLSSIIFFWYLFKDITPVFSLTLSFFLSYLTAFLFLLRLDFKFLIICLRIFLRSISLSSLSTLFREQAHLIKYGWPLALWFTISSLLNISDRYVIGYYLSDTELGTYSAVYDLLYKGITLLYSPILIAGYPILARKYNDGFKRDAMKFLRKLIYIEMLLFCLVIAVAFPLRSFFIENVVGIPLSQESFELVIPIVCGAFAWQLAMLMHKPLELQFKTQTMLIFVLIALILNVTLNVLFIKQLGAVFAAYSTFISATLYLLLNFSRTLFKNP